MKTNLSLLAGLLFLVAVVSCKKEDTKDDGPKETQYEIVELSTKHGTVYLWLYDKTPLHKANFLKLAKEGFYNNTLFHRCIDSFMIQGGDPLSKDNDPSNDGTGGPGYTIPNEIAQSSTHKRGSLAAARQGDDINPTRASSGSQFYICQATTGAVKNLNGQYTVYGEVMKGIEMVDEVLKQQADGAGRPMSDIPMQVKVLLKTKAEIKTLYGFDIP